MCINTLPSQVSYFPNSELCNSHPIFTHPAHRIMTAPPPTPTPKFVYKIYPNTKSFEIPTPYPSDFTFPQDQLDQSSGYFHMSSKDQLPGTLGFFFDSHKIVQILKIDYVKLSAAKTVKWELGDDGKAYPHLYALLSGEFVVEVKVVDKGTSWSETATTLEKEGWLEY